MIEYRIREPRITEIPECIKVIYSSFGRPLNNEIYQDEKKAWRMLFKNNMGKFLISEERGKIFGIGGVFFFKEICSFGYMGVLPKYRGKKVGTEIFRRLFNIAKKLGYKTMMLYASKLGEPIYKKFGFQSSCYGKTYNLPKSLPELNCIRKKIISLRKFPDWLLNLDKEAMGFDRSKYLNMKKTFNGKILAVEGEAYGFLLKNFSKNRLGPLISTNINAALQIIKKSITLGANQIIITLHHSFPNKIFKLIKLTELENGASLKMYYGKLIPENLNLLYAIGTFTKT